MEEGKDKTISIRLPKVQVEFLDLMNEQYGFTANNTIKQALLLHQNSISGLLQNHTILPSEIIPKPKKKKSAKSYHSARQNDTKSKSPSRAHDIEILYKDILKINKNNIYIVEFVDPDSQKVWMDFLQMRKEKKKPITQTMMGYQVKRMEKIIEKGGEELLVKKLRTAIENGWQGYDYDDPSEPVDNNNETTFTDDD